MEIRSSIYESLLYKAAQNRIPGLILALHLNEHGTARWLSTDELDSIKWLPADMEVVEKLKSHQRR